MSNRRPSQVRLLGGAVGRTHSIILLAPVALWIADQAAQRDQGQRDLDLSASRFRKARPRHRQCRGSARSANGTFQRPGKTGAQRPVPTLRSGPPYGRPVIRRFTVPRQAL